MPDLPSHRFAPLPGFAWSCHTGGGAAWLCLTGELDLASAPVLHDFLEEQPGSTPIVLDLRRLQFIDCAGVRVILGAAERAARSGPPVRVVRGRDCVDRVFALTGAYGHVELMDPAQGAQEPPLQ